MRLARECRSRTIGPELVIRILYTVLCLRRPVILLLGMLAGAGLCSFPVIAVEFSGQERSNLLWLTGGMAVIGLGSAWFYDVVLRYVITKTCNVVSSRLRGINP
jgi:hypothetical protein